MVSAYSKALDQHIEIKRILGKVESEEVGPTIVFVAGMHGNEPSGVIALNKVFSFLEKNDVPTKGKFYGLVGNIKALQQGIRYLDEDLNRIWTDEHVENLYTKSQKSPTKETSEQIELYELIKKIIDESKGPLFFIDLHTTSSKTIPFTLVNDTLLNRRYVAQYPVPMILGIEEYLDGPLLNYINKLGYVAFGYESGQHDAKESIKYHESFIYLTLAFTEFVSSDSIDFNKHFKTLSSSSRYEFDAYEIFDTHMISDDEQFEMKPGFENFQPIKKGQKLALSNGKNVVASSDGHIFMPLYQSHGDEGFFIIRKVPKIFLQLSALFRKVKFDRLLPILPGVTVHPDKDEVLLVNRKIARFFAKQFFHLLGYRSKHIKGNYLEITNRETHSRTDEYPRFG